MKKTSIATERYLVQIENQAERFECAHDKLADLCAKIEAKKIIIETNKISMLEIALELISEEISNTEDRE